jgi:hypothetical protein
MMRIGEHRNVIIMLAASFALFAQSDDFPVKSQDHSSVPDVRQIVESSIAATQRHWQARLHYTYMEREESRRRDLAGRVRQPTAGRPMYFKRRRTPDIKRRASTARCSPR